jgi:hypothetical protein
LLFAVVLLRSAAYPKALFCVPVVLFRSAERPKALFSPPVADWSAYAPKAQLLWLPEIEESAA